MSDYFAYWWPVCCYFIGVFIGNIWPLTEKKAEGSNNENN